MGVSVSEEGFIPLSESHSTIIALSFSILLFAIQHPKRNSNDAASKRTNVDAVSKDKGRPAND
jgi:hypothetical protein